MGSSLLPYICDAYDGAAGLHLPWCCRRGQQPDASTSVGAVVPAGAAKDSKAAGKKGGKVPSGTRMLEEMRKKGKPISPKLQQMADWLDSLEAGAGRRRAARRGAASACC